MKAPKFRHLPLASDGIAMKGWNHTERTHRVRAKEMKKQTRRFLKEADKE